MKPPKGPQRELPEEGAHNGVCVQLIDLGTQPSGNPDWPAKRKILVGFELPDIENEDGGATIVSQQFGFSSSNRGNLSKTLKQWQAVKNLDAFDMDDCLGKPAAITIIHNETDKGVFANISNIGALPKGTKVRKAQTALVSLYLDETFEQEVYEALPEWIRVKIASSPEYEEVMANVKPKKAPAKPAAGKKR